MVRFSSGSPFHHVLKGFKGEQFSFILGQEPDTLNGGFSSIQSFRGKISEFNLWNYSLSAQIIESMGRCEQMPSGNILAWNKAYLTVYGTQAESIDSKTFCEPLLKLVPIYRPLLLNEAVDYCTFHGGYVYTPTSEEDNKKVIKMFQNHNCSNHDNQNFLWLGFTQSKGFLETHPNKSVPTFTNNLQFSLKDNDCVTLKLNGKWKINLRDACSTHKYCFLCAFDREPIYTLRGICPNAAYDLHYYMNPSDHGIEFIGYKKGKISYSDPSWVIDYDTTAIYFQFFSGSPLGRQKWNRLNAPCTAEMQQQLTLSICNEKDYFTCDSGECIDLKRLCDHTNDCKDNSDEVNCKVIYPDPNYSLTDTPDNAGTFNPLWTSVTIIQFDEVNPTKRHLTITMDIQIHWSDHRLTFANLQGDNFNIYDITGEYI